jgi:hypothetical protein
LQRKRPESVVREREAVVNDVTLKFFLPTSREDSQETNLIVKSKGKVFIRLRFLLWEYILTKKISLV